MTSIWFWDAQQGIPYYAQEEYNVIIVNEQGLANEFKIKSRSYYRKFRARNDAGKVALAERLKENLEKDNPQLNVRVTDNGVAISLPDLFFDTDSAKLNKRRKSPSKKLRSCSKPPTANMCVCADTLTAPAMKPITSNCRKSAPNVSQNFSSTVRT